MSSSDRDDAQPEPESPGGGKTPVEAPGPEPETPSPPPAFGTERIQESDFAPEVWVVDDDNEVPQ